MIPFDTFTLPNGLRVVHSYDPQSALVVLNVLYDTGARDESRDLTGIAHLFEHLMFGGSANVEAFDTALERAGGENNAATSSDFTYFYDQVPAQNVETAFYLESDRMLGLAFSDRALEVQRHVVIEEFKQMCLNQPYGDLMHTLRALLYPPEHPYSWPVIGLEPSHIARVSQDEVRKWFYAHYAPNNAILGITGNVTTEHAKALAEKWFGPIPRRDVPQRHIVDAPWPTGKPKVEVMYGNVPQTLIAIAWRMDPYGHRGYLAADAITDILSAGKSARLFQRLVMGSDLFTMADASITGSEHSGMLIMKGSVAREDDEAIAQAQAMLLDQAQQLAQKGNVSDYELERTKNRYESTTTFENINLVSLSLNLCMAAYHGININDKIPAYRALTLDDIADTARRIFVDSAPVIVIYRPKNA